MASEPEKPPALTKLMGTGWGITRCPLLRSSELPPGRLQLPQSRRVALSLINANTHTIKVQHVFSCSSGTVDLQGTWRRFPRDKRDVQRKQPLPHLPGDLHRLLRVLGGDAVSIHQPEPKESALRTHLHQAMAPCSSHTRTALRLSEA